MRLLTSIFLLLSVTGAVLVPGPTGPYAVAVKVQPFTDTSRADPLDPTGNSKTRRLLTSIFLPVDQTRRSCSAQTVPYMTSPVAAAYGQQAAQVGLPDDLYYMFEMDFCDLAKLSPCGRAGGKNKKYPLILFDPGFGESRLIYGAMARSLASHGYVVVSIDHPFDANAVEFPDGTVITGADLDDDDLATLQKVLQVRTDDITFIIDQLKNTTIMNPLLSNFPGTIDYDQLAIWGHSFGGATAASLTHSDPRILGGLDLDGMLIDPILSTEISKPFILAGRKGHEVEDPTWNQFWPHLTGKSMEIAITDTQHGAFKDILMLLSVLPLPVEAVEAVQELLGSIDPHQLDKDLNGILVAFFDLIFHGKAAALQNIEHDYANVTIVRSNNLQLADVDE